MPAINPMAKPPESGPDEPQGPPRVGRPAVASETAGQPDAAMRKTVHGMAVKPEDPEPAAPSSSKTTGSKTLFGMQAAELGLGLLKPEENKASTPKAPEPESQSRSKAGSQTLFGMQAAELGLGMFQSDKAPAAEAESPIPAIGRPSLDDGKEVDDEMGSTTMFGRPGTGSSSARGDAGASPPGGTVPMQMSDIARLSGEHERGSSAESDSQKGSTVPFKLSDVQPPPDQKASGAEARAKPGLDLNVSDVFPFGEDAQPAMGQPAQRQAARPAQGQPAQRQPDQPQLSQRQHVQGQPVQRQAVRPAQARSVQHQTGRPARAQPAQRQPDQPQPAQRQPDQPAQRQPDQPQPVKRAAGPAGQVRSPAEKKGSRVGQQPEAVRGASQAPVAQRSILASFLFLLASGGLIASMFLPTAASSFLRLTNGIVTWQDIAPAVLGLICLVMAIPKGVSKGLAGLVTVLSVALVLAIVLTGGLQAFQGGMQMTMRLAVLLAGSFLAFLAGITSLLKSEKADLED